MKRSHLFLYSGVICLFWTTLTLAQDGSDILKSSNNSSQGGLTLSQAVMCQEIRDFKPYLPSVVFPIRLGKAICYVSFVNVPEKKVIYHHWYRYDVLTTTIKLEVQPPNWSTYSLIQLREADKGPWRVEITDQDGKILQTLRFSITD